MRRSSQRCELVRVSWHCIALFWRCAAWRSGQEQIGTLANGNCHDGMVVAQEAAAARIGVDILKKGGNAVDAAVAVGFAMAVTYPRAGNIGGGGFMVIHRANGDNVTIDYRETAPAAITAKSFLDAQGNADPQKSRNSALAIGVPGTVAGLALAEEKYGSGRFTLADLIAPAIALARDGIYGDRADLAAAAIRSIAAQALAVLGENISQSRTAARFSRRRPPGAKRSRQLARSHRARRAARLLRGPIAQKIAAAVQAAGGVMTRRRSEKLSRGGAHACARHLSRLRHRLHAAAVLRRRRAYRDAQHSRRL